MPSGKQKIWTYEARTALSGMSLGPNTANDKDSSDPCGVEATATATNVRSTVPGLVGLADSNIQPNTGFRHGTASRTAKTASPRRTITIREYTLWKASGVKAYSEYLVWKNNHMDVDPPVMVKLRDRPDPRGAEIDRMVAEALADERRRIKKFKNGLWGTQFV